MSAGLGRSYTRVAVLCQGAGLVCSVSISPHHIGKLTQNVLWDPLAGKHLHSRPVCLKGAGRHLTPCTALALSASEHLHTECFKCLLPSQGIHQEGKPRKHFRPQASTLHCAGWSSNESSAFCSQLRLHPSSSGTTSSMSLESFQHSRVTSTLPHLQNPLTLGKKEPYKSCLY